jgi:hypothetical protein
LNTRVTRYATPAHDTPSKADPRPRHQSFESDQGKWIKRQMKIIIKRRKEKRRTWVRVSLRWVMEKHTRIIPVNDPNQPHFKKDNN